MAESMARVGGVDLSLTGLALVAVPSDWGTDWSRVLNTTLETRPADGCVVQRMRDLACDAATWLEWAGCSHVWLEQAMVTRKQHNVDQAFRLGGMVEMRVWELMNLECRWAPLIKARRLFCGSMAKADAQRVLVEATDVLEDEHQRDAFVVANWGLSELLRLFEGGAEGVTELLHGTPAVQNPWAELERVRELRALRRLRKGLLDALRTAETSCELSATRALVSEALAGAPCSPRSTCPRVGKGICPNRTTSSETHTQGRRETMADGSREKREFPFDLSAKEVDQRKNQLVKVEREIDDELDEKRAEMAARNATLKELRADRKGLLDACHTGKENREVEVLERWDWRRNIVEFVRTDTDEVVEERAMTGPERQETMGFESDGNGQARRAPKLGTQKKAKKGGRGKGGKGKGTSPMRLV